MRAGILPALAAESIGTALLVGIATGAAVAGANAGGVAQWVLAVAAFIAVSLPVLLFAFVSGSHINPAVTLALWAAGRFPRRDVAPYAAAQLLGAFTGSLGVLITLGSSIHLAATVPAGGDWSRAMGAEFAFTFLLAFSVCGLVHFGPGPRRIGLLLPGTVVGVATYVIGPWTGCSLNPARTLAPAVLSGTYTDIWVYLLAVPLGALAAASVARWLLPPARSDAVDLAVEPPRQVAAHGGGG